MKLEFKINSLISEKELIKSGQTVICALSGGADSTAMTCLLAELGKKRSFRVIAAHVNHSIRGAESDRDEAFSKSLAEKLGIDFYSVRIDVPALAKERGEGIELCARKARYEFFRLLAKETGAGYVATAHNADDNLETAVLNLVRGTGIRGLAGIPLKRQESSYTLIRPLLYTQRQEIEEYLTRIGQEYVTDSTNLTDDYARNQIRHSIIPGLKKLNPSVSKTFEASSILLSEQSDFIERESGTAFEKLYEAERSCVSVRELMSVHPALRGGVIVRMYRKSLGDDSAGLSFSHIAETVGICSGAASVSSAVSLPGGIRARREYDRLIIDRADASSSELSPVLLREGETAAFGDYLVTLLKVEKLPANYKSVNNFFVDCSKIYGKLSIRTRLTGDEIHLAGHAHSASLKKLMIDRKIPRSIRSGLPVITDDCGIAAAAFIGTDRRVMVDENTRGIYEIKIEMK